MRCGRSHLHPSPGRRVSCAGGVKSIYSWIFEYHSTSDTPRQGRAPPPGGDCPSIGCQGDEHQPPFRWIPRQDPIPAPRALYPGQSSCTARPPEGAGGGRGSGREVGVVNSSPRKTVFRREGASPPPSRGIPHRWTAPWFACSTVLAYLASTPVILRSGGFQPFCRSFSVCGSRQRSSRFS